MMSKTGARRRHRGLGLGTVAALAALVVISGCAQTARLWGPEAELNDAAPSQVPGAEVFDAFDCRSEPSSWRPDTEEPTLDPSIPVPGRVPDGFEATAAVRCTLDFGTLAPVGGPAGDVFWRVERFEGDLGPLLAALAEPDDAPPPGELLCTADMEFVPPLWLEGRVGAFVPVHYPRDACGKTKPAVRDALDALPVVLVERIKLTQSTG